MRVLLTGANGFIGKNLVQFLQPYDFDVVPFLGDVTNEKDIEKNFSQNIQAVIHLASYGNDSIHDQESILGIQKSLEVNTISTARFIQYLLASSAKIFIYAGSSSEYGTSDQDMSISTPLYGKTPYAVTKSASSHLTQLSYPGKWLKTLRLFSVYGPYEKAHRFIPTAFRCAISGKPMKLAPGVHDFVYIADVCRAFKYLLEHPELSPTISHAASGVQYTNQEVIAAIENLTGKDIYTLPSEKIRSFDTEKRWRSTKDSLLIEPHFSLHQGLEKTWQFLQQTF